MFIIGNENTCFLFYGAIFFLFISLLAQRNEAKKMHHERQPKVDFIQKAS